MTAPVYIEFSDERGMAVLVARAEVAMIREAPIGIGQVSSTIVLRSGAVIGLTTEFAAAVKRVKGN